MRSKCVLLALSLFLMVNVSTVCWGQTLPDDRYVRPPAAIEEIFERDKNFDTLNWPSPDHRLFLLPHYRELSTLEQMSKPTLRLAMLELRPAVDREWRLDTFGYDGLDIFTLDRSSSISIRLPADVLISDMMWSPDSSKVAFLVHAEDGSHVWVADAVTGEASPLSERRVIATLAVTRSFGRPRPGASQMLQWTPDGGVLALLEPEGRGAPPSKPEVAPSPIVRRTRDKKTPNPTYPFLLKNEHDRDLFRYHTTSQLALLKPGQSARSIGSPGMYESFSLSPDGKHILAERIVEPLSPLTGYSNFGTKLEVIGVEDGVAALVREVPLREGSGDGDSNPQRDLPREVSWLPQSASLYFLWREPRDPENKEAPRQDRLMRLDPPYELDSAVQVLVSADAMADALPSKDARYAFATVTGRRDGDFSGKKKIVAWDLGNGGQQYSLTDAWDAEDPLQDPGELWSAASSNGVRWVLQSSDESSVYLRGPGYREDLRPRPFVDAVNIQDGSKVRKFEGSGEYFDEPLVALDEDLQRMIVSRESATTFPDSYLRSSDGSFDNITNNVDPFPEITSAKRIDFEFKRRDGLTVQARISLPVDYQAGSRVPAMFWTYPREYPTEKAYRSDSIRSRNQNAYTPLSYLRWSDLWLTQGYALVYPDVPIIGPGNTYNNNYISDLSDTLYAAIRKTDQLGYVDPDRVGHGGHSYGAFATANLLANTPYFKAGIAGDGAYNRTLTPMGFQRERRFIWEAQDIYIEMSPFFKADHIDSPLLMYHGADDNNTGTFPIQSERMMQALTGLGKTAVLFKYPYESHGPSAKETYLDLWARFIEWFDLYVKEPREKSAEEPTSSKR